jgi:hypothetical protein
MLKAGEEKVVSITCSIIQVCNEWSLALTGLKAMHARPWR